MVLGLFALTTNHHGVKIAIVDPHPVQYKTRLF